MQFSIGSVSALAALQGSKKSVQSDRFNIAPAAVGSSTSILQGVTWVCWVGFRLMKLAWRLFRLANSIWYPLVSPQPV